MKLVRSLDIHRPDSLQCHEVKKHNCQILLKFSQCYILKSHTAKNHKLAVSDKKQNSLNNHQSCDWPCAQAHPREMFLSFIFTAQCRQTIVPECGNDMLLVDDKFEILLRRKPAAHI